MSILTAHLKMPEKDDHVTSQVHWECVSPCKLYLLTFIVYTVYLTGLRTEVIYPESSTKMLRRWNVSLLHEIMSLSTFAGSHFVSLIHDCFFWFFCPLVCFWIYPHPICWCTNSNTQHHQNTYSANVTYTDETRCKHRCHSCHFFSKDGEQLEFSFRTWLDLVSF